MNQNLIFSQSHNTIIKKSVKTLHATSLLTVKQNRMKKNKTYS